MTLDDIERLVRAYADAREDLNAVIAEIQDIRRRAVRERLRTIRARVAHAGAAHERVRDAIREHKDLFAKPRTHSVHGVKFGIRKAPGRLEGDQAAAIGRIRKRMPQDAARLIRVKESLNLPAVRGLSTADLAAIGMALVETDDQIVLSAASDELDRLVDALLTDLDGGAAA